MKLLSCFVVIFLSLFLCCTAHDPMDYDYDYSEPQRRPGWLDLPRRPIHTAWTRREVHSFEGIRYGIVPDKSRRFQRAQPVEGLDGYEITPRARISCPSFPDLLKVEQAEAMGIDVDDCLTLSVFMLHNIDSKNRPSTLRTTVESQSPHPVIVYVHGEMLFDGNADEANPEYLLEKDVVLVTVNYRLGPFGFMSTQTDEIPGNVALADLEMALQWVVKNIDRFNGNPNNITVMGQAGGAALIHALILSEKMAGIKLNKVILQSGTALSPLFVDENPVNSARGIARAANCPYSRFDVDITKCLLGLNTSQILSAFVTYCNQNEPRGLNAFGGFRIAVGDKLGYIPLHPRLMARSFKFPLLAGMTKDAGAFILTRRYDELVRLNSRNITNYIDVVLKHTTMQKYFYIWRQWALDNIFTEQDIRNPVLNNLASGLLELTNYILFKGPLLESIQTSWRTNDTYLYSFDYRGMFHRFPRRRTQFPYEIDANLSDDNIYLFPFPKEVSRLNDADKTVAQLMVRLWTNFVATGKPEEERVWPKVNNDYGPFVRITGQLELDYHFGEGVPVANLTRPRDVGLFMGRV